MKKNKIIMIVVAIILIVSGTIIGAIALATKDFDLSEVSTVSTMHFVTNTYNMDEAFSDITIEGAESDIRFLTSEDDSCKVVCNEAEEVYHSVEVKNDTLTIKRIDTRKWYDNVGINMGRMEIFVYLPQTEYEALYVKSVSGAIDIPKDFGFKEAELGSTSGDVNFTASVQNELSIETVSGNLYVGDISPKSLKLHSTSGEAKISSVNVESDLTAETVSGNFQLINIACRNITAESTSGEVDLTNVNVSENIHIESVSGDVTLMECDADALWVDTSSGDVSGTLLTEKIFITDTSSGDIDVPNSASGGKCEITTVSGNIEFTIQ